MKRLLIMTILISVMSPFMALAADTEEEILDFDAEEKLTSTSNLTSMWNDLSLQLYIDLIYEYREDLEESGFDSNHVLAYMKGDITGKLSFEIDLNFDYQYEIKYRLFPGGLLRAGKILVPFSDYPGHALFGGKIYDEPNGVIPNLFYDYGLALNYNLYDGDLLYTNVDVAVVNGFQELGSGFFYMDARGAPDNNHKKAVVFRLMNTLANRYQLTYSAYQDWWSNDGDRGFVMQAVDFKLGRGFLPVKGFDKLQITGGYLQGQLESIDDSENSHSGWFFDYATKTAGCYAELDYEVTDPLRLVLRGGMADPDTNYSEEGGDIIYSVSAYYKFEKSLELMVSYEFNNELDGPDIDDDRIFGRLRLKI